MIISTLMTLGSEFFFSGAGLIFAIAALAFIAGAEIACILILIGKMRNANPKKKRAEEETGDTPELYGALFLATGSIAPLSVPVLTILAALTAFLALVMVILLAVCVKKGYVFAPSADKHAEEPTLEEPVSEEPTLEEPVREPLDVFGEPAPEPYFAEQEEEPVQEEPLAEPFYSYEAEEALPAFAETEEAEPETVEEAEGTVLSEELAPAPANPTAGPVRVVEKVVTETYKEIVKEAPRQETSAAGDALLEKLTDFLDYEMQKRRESEAEASDAEEKKTASTASAVIGRGYDAEDEDEDSDEEDETDMTDEDADGEELPDDEPEDGDRFTGNERIIGFDEETGCYIVAHYRKSFEAKLIQARPNIKSYYSDLKNALLSYKGTKSRISWTADSFHNGRTQLAKINVKTRILEIYLALEPESLDGTVYRGKNVGNKKKYAETPFLYKIRTPRKFNWAMELVQRTCEEHGLTPIDIQPIDYTEQYPFDTTENLVERKLIKEYIRQEKPATSFELSEDHVTAVPEEDPTVIPANANFSWEFDNERMEEKAEELAPVEEPIAEEAPAPEAPAPAPAAEAEPAVIRETVKITETRYTEHYYADNTVEYDKSVLTSEPAPEELAPPAEEEFTADKFEGADPFASFRYEDEELPEDIENGEETVEEIEEVEETEALEVPEEADDTAEIEETPESEETVDEDVLDDEEPQFFAPDREAVQVIETVEELPDLTDEEEIEEVEEVLVEEYEEIPDEALEEAEEVASEEVEEEYEEVEEIPSPAPAPARVSEPANPEVAVIDICAVERYFTDGALINLEALKKAGLALPMAKKLKVYATGDLRMSFTVEANHFTLDAIRAISMADGEIQMLV